MVPTSSLPQRVEFIASSLASYIEVLRAARPWYTDGDVVHASYGWADHLSV